MKKMTRKEFFGRCKEIMASEVLTEKEKKENVEYEAHRLVEDIIWTFPEMKDWLRRQEEMELKYSYKGIGVVYCPHCSTWTPKAPPEIKTLESEWRGVMDRKVAEFIEKARKGAAA